MNDKLIVSTSPHFHSKVTTSSIMLDVLIALLPSAIAAMLFFGWRALIIMCICVVSALLSEFLFNIITRRKQTVGDLSAIVTGMLLSLSLPATAGIWHCVLGSVFAIVAVKCIFGGLGRNFANPAVAARVFLVIAFSDVFTVATNTLFESAELVSSATPLSIIQGAEGDLPSILDMFLGNCGGSIGETCALALLIGFVYLLVKRVISWETTTVYVGVVFILSLIFNQDIYLALYQVLSGGLLFGAIFMATDYVTTPINKFGKIIFALGCAIITFVIRYFGNMPEGVSFAILIMNILTPYIDKIDINKPVGGVKNEK